MQRQGEGWEMTKEEKNSNKGGSKSMKKKEKKEGSFLPIIGTELQNKEEEGSLGSAIAIT